MNFAECKAVVSRITYKPNVKINVLEDRTLYGGPHLLLEFAAHVSDVRTGEPTTIHQRATYPLAALNGEEHLVYFIHENVRRMEMHELDEWFKLDGVHFRDPHAPGA